MTSEAGLVRLRNHSLNAVLAPERGGSIARFDYIAGGSTVPILRGVDGMPDSVLDAGSFPLVPYCNRIRGGRFTFRGREIVQAPNMPPDPSPLHGQGWLGAWEVERARETEADLVYRHQPGEWPWAYEARQIFVLDDHGLSILLCCRNVSDEPMPCGLGQHPYFLCADDTLLETRVQGAWTVDEDVLPVKRVAPTGVFDLTERLICGQDLDNGFDGWSGKARMHTPGQPFAIELVSPDAPCFQLYSPVEGGLFVAEPVSHVNAAMNEPEEEWERLGLKVLAPGEEMSLHARICVIPA
jgi:aldose 1-epimerase